MYFFSDDLGIDVQVGLLKESTEIIVNSNAITSTKILNGKIISIDQNVDNDALVDTIDTIDQNDCISVTKYNNRYVFRTVLVEETLLECNYIYDYCALISKSHSSIINTNNSYDFVRMSFLHKLNQNDELQNEIKIKTDTSLIIHLCPLDKLMNNVEKIEVITWPTIYVTKTISKMLGLTMNSKVVLEPINQNSNNIYDVENIFVYPLKEMVR